MWLNFVFITFFYYSSLLKCYLTHFSPMHLSSNVFLVWRKGALGNKWVNSLFSKDSIKAINKNYLKSSLFKVNNGSTRIMCEICSELTIRHQRGVMGVVLSSLLIKLNRFYSLFWCFHCWKVMPAGVIRFHVSMCHHFDQWILASEKLRAMMLTNYLQIYKNIYKL